LTQHALRTANAVDFDDLITLTVTLLKEQPSELARWQRKFRHVLVDEFQDTSKVQFDLVQLLTQQHRSLFVVGDSNQVGQGAVRPRSAAHSTAPLPLRCGRLQPGGSEGFRVLGFEGFCLGLV
jgi:hypothetical protein